MGAETLEVKGSKYDQGRIKASKRHELQKVFSSEKKKKIWPMHPLAYDDCYDRSKKTSKFRVTGLCKGNAPVYCRYSVI